MKPRRFKTAGVIHRVTALVGQPTSPPAGATTLWRLGDEILRVETRTPDDGTCIVGIHDVNDRPVRIRWAGSEFKAYTSAGGLADTIEAWLWNVQVFLNVDKQAFELRLNYDDAVPYLLRTCNRERVSIPEQFEAIALSVLRRELEPELFIDLIKHEGIVGEV